MLGKRQLKSISEILSVDLKDMIEYRDRQEKLKEIIEEDAHGNLREDYARGIPDFAIAQIASDAAEELKRALKLHITQTCRDPGEQRRKFSAAAVVVDELESELKEKIEDKLLQFMRSV